MRLAFDASRPLRRSTPGHRPLLARACLLALSASLALVGACADPGVGNTGWNANGNWWLDSSGRSPFDSGGGETDQDVIVGTDEDGAIGEDAVGPDDVSEPMDDALGSDAGGTGTDAATVDAAGPADVAVVDTVDAKSDAGSDTAVDGGPDAGADAAVDAKTDTKIDTKIDTGGGQWWDDPDTDAGSTPEPDTTGPALDGSTLPGGGLCAPNFENTNVEVTSGGGGKLDIVIWVDTSGSMSQEAAWVNQNLVKFMNYIAGKGIDYRVIMFGNGLGLCGSGCPVNDPQHFLWVKQYVSSKNGPNLISTATQFNKYQSFLRPDAVHNIVAVSDDNCSLLPASFIQNYKNLLKGAGKNENFVYHSIVSFVNASNPEQYGNCNGGASYGSFHISVSKQTGGSMFQLCQKDWTIIFDQLAKSVAATVKATCAYDIPVPAGKKLVASALQVSYLSSQAYQPLKNVAKKEECGAIKDGWYYDDPQAPKVVHLCPEQCQAIVDGGKLLFNFGCM